MAERIEVVNGELKVTKSEDVIVSTMTKREVEGKKAEAQTKVDHLQLDLTEAQAEVTKWDDYLKVIDKE